ncbi:hypothetical protein SAY87_019866 [Trapa incisa]|uniref:Uncharacterized protein n=1 Tax=Trapa incisa TaxID=236973 RepID=A0AAN7K0I9_9MYRT|nr:hypothetical protein SAY87_019866 [Trapa incisa]
MARLRTCSIHNLHPSLGFSIRFSGNSEAQDCDRAEEDDSKYECESTHLSLFSDLGGRPGKLRKEERRGVGQVELTVNGRGGQIG